MIKLKRGFGKMSRGNNVPPNASKKIAIRKSGPHEFSNQNEVRLMIKFKQKYITIPPKIANKKGSKIEKSVCIIMGGLKI